MSTRLPLGWARILDCLPSLDHSAPNMIALPTTTGSLSGVAADPTSAESGKLLCLDNALPGIPASPNFLGCIIPLDVRQIS